MRCVVGLNKVIRYRQQTGLPIVSATVRGGTNHDVVLCLRDGSTRILHKDGSIYHSAFRWKHKHTLLDELRDKRGRGGSKSTA